MTAAITARPRRWQWRAELSTARRARQATRRALTAWELEQLASDAALVVSELVANACLHGGGPVTVVLRRTPAGISGDVGDAMPAWPVRLTLPRRHGLTIVLKLVRDHRLEVRPRAGGGKVVRFEMEL